MKARALFVVALALASVACSETGARPSAPSSSAGEAPAVFRAKCGACHVPVEPGSVPHDELSAALERHRRRVKLTEGQWRDLKEYLEAQPASSRANAAARPSM